MSLLIIPRCWHCLPISGEFWDGEQEIRYKINKISDREILQIQSMSMPKNYHCTFQLQIASLPYKRSSQSGVASIAISYGLPIVAFDVGGLSESIGECPQSTSQKRMTLRLHEKSGILCQASPNSMNGVRMKPKRWKFCIFSKP